MTLPSTHYSVLGLAIATALSAMLQPATASAAETVIIRDAELERIQPSTHDHAEVYDSKVTNHDVGGDRGWSAVSISRGNLRMERTQVSTTGAGMAALGYYGADRYNNGIVHDAVIEGSDFTTSGDKAFGLQFSWTSFDSSTGALDKVGTITVRDSRVATTGRQSHALSIAGVNTVNYHGGDIRTSGQDAVGVHLMGGFVRLQDSEIVTEGDGAHGIHARSMRWSIGGRPGVVYRADVTLEDTRVDTHGAGSVGILAGFEDLGSPEGIGSIVRLDNASVRSLQSHAVQFLGGKENELLLTGGSVLDGGDAILFAGLPDSVNRVSATDSTLIGRGAQAVVADTGAVLHLGLDNSDLLVEAGKGMAWASQGGRIDLQAKGSRLQGTAFADDTSRLDVTLDGSRWDAWGHSQVDALSLRNSSTLLLGAGSVGDQLIVRGDFTIDDSTLVFDSALGDDRSPTDFLWVRGNTSGQGNIAVNNAGGRGAQTANGIQLIAVDGDSNAAFKLQGRAVGGVYEYFLHKGSRTDPDDGGWYLRSELNDAPEPCTGQDGCEPPPRPVPCSVDAGQGHCEPEVIVPPPAPVLRPEIGAYLANQSAAAGMFGTRLQDRSGSDRGASRRGAWARVARHQADYGVIGEQLRVSGDTDVLQIGTDLLSWGDGSRGRLGVMLGTGRATATVTSRLTGYAARGRVEGQALGVYASWMQNPSVGTGLYLDASANHASFKNSVQGDALGKERYDSKTSSASIEAGYGIQIVDGDRVALFVEPQAQLRYTRFSADRHVESNGTVIDGSDGGGLGSRVGVRMSGDASAASGIRVQPFLAANWFHESSDNSLRFDGERLVGGLPRDRYELSGGAEVRLSQRWSGRGTLGWQRGGGYREVAGEVALRASW
jgi:autotransporter family porin